MLRIGPNPNLVVYSTDTLAAAHVFLAIDMPILCLTYQMDALTLSPSGIGLNFYWRRMLESEVDVLSKRGRKLACLAAAGDAGQNTAFVICSACRWIYRNVPRWHLVPLRKFQT